MSTFLRKIKKSLIETGSARKYFLYALGEILLVVVGILIALKINNWNIEQQQRQQEEILLVEMKKNLEQDLQIFEVQVKELTSRRNKVAELSRILQEGVTLPADSLFPYFGAVYGVVPSRINIAIYENLKSHGFDLIKDDSLRVAINRYFEEGIHSINQYTLSEQSVNEVIKPYYLKQFKAIQFRETAKPIDLEYVLKDVTYRNLVDYRLINFDANQLTHHPWFISAMKKLISMIEEDLST